MDSKGVSCALENKLVIVGLSLLFFHFTLFVDIRWKGTSLQQCPISHVVSLNMQN